jgi:anti-sigma B factor antagonist
MNVTDTHAASGNPVSQTTVWPVGPGGNRATSGDPRPLLNTSSHEGILRVSFGRDRILEAALIRQIQSELFTLLDRAAETNVLLDFRLVRALSSSAFGMLVSLAKRCKMLKIDLKLCNLASDIREIFKVTGLDKILDVQPNAEKAEQAFAKKGRFFR